MQKTKSILAQIMKTPIQVKKIFTFCETFSEKERLIKDK